MVETLIISLPSLGNIAGLIILFMIIFGILGRTLFFNVSENQDEAGRMDSHANYATLDKAFMSLFRQTTGEAWNGMMYYCSQSDIFLACDKSYSEYLNDGCGGSFVGIAFHFAWQIFGTYLMMQLFTAVILENFHELAKGEASVVPIEKLNEFVDTWTYFDPDACHEIDVVLLPELVQKLTPPLGVKTKTVSRCNLMQVIKDLAIPIRGGKVTYQETFMCCVKRVLDADVEEEEPEEEVVKSASMERLRQTAPEGSRMFRKSSNVEDPIFRGRRMTAAEDFAARSVQKAYKDWREKRIQLHKGVNRTNMIPLFANNIKEIVIK